MTKFIVCAAIAGCLCGATSIRARELTFEDRVNAQRAIEQVYWNHRIWPKENPVAKPPFSAVMSDETIRARVEDYLKKSNALDTWWRRPITGEQIQDEMDRMAGGSRDPQVLQELFAALGNDPYVIAETLARQVLVDRLIRNWYGYDTRFHAEVRAKAETALARCSSVDCMRSMGGEYQETTLSLATEDEVRDRNRIDNSMLRVTAAGLKEAIDELATKFHASPDLIPTRRLSALDESSESFGVSAVLSRSAEELTVATVTWTKLPFDRWWAARRESQSQLRANANTLFVPAAVATSACTNDTWLPTFALSQFSPASAVWTGSEMIMWNGRSGVRYTPSTDSWRGVSASSFPLGSGARPVWTGTEMIVWGAPGGGRYNPASDMWTAMPTGGNEPSSRGGASSVWTGTEMIVWGGANICCYLTSGGRFNPSTNTWLPTSTGPNTPTAHYGYTTVWTGAEMIIWGGAGSFGDLNTGARYNPTTDTWTPTSTGVNVPSGREYHTAVWTGTEMIIWGGLGQPGYLNTGARYNPSTNTWSPTSATAAPIWREFHTAVWTGSEMIVWGGYYSTGPETNPVYPNSGGRYNPATDSWTATSTGANTPIGRYTHVTVWSGSEMIIWGGEGTSGMQQNGGRYSPATDTWVPTSNGNVPTPRTGHSTVWTGSELIVWGGNSVSGPYHVFNDGSRYNVATLSWTPTSMGPNAPPPMSGHSAVWTGLEMILWGDANGAGGRYNPTTDTWSRTSMGPNVPSGRGGQSAVWTGTEMIIWGGGYSGISRNDGGRYNPAIDAWVPTSTGAGVPAPRSNHTAVWTGNEMIVWGGSSDFPASTALNTGGRYDPIADSWAATSVGTNVPDARGNHTASWSGTKMIVWGGLNALASYLNTGGLYDPSIDSWIPTSTAAGVPSPRQYATSIWTGTEMIVWGGYTPNGTTTNTGGRYNPSTDNWSTTSTGTNAPAARYGHGAAWTGREMVIWGANDSSNGDTGASYCACPSGLLVYRDADGDGYGDPALSTPACDGVPPAGYVANRLDCNDANAAVHPGAPELNDGIDNQCPGDPGYGIADEISDTLKVNGDGVISWADTSGAATFDVARSASNNMSPCEIIGTATSGSPSVTDAAVPPFGGGFYYLVRAASAHIGSWGMSSSGAERSLACP